MTNTKIEHGEPRITFVRTVLRKLTSQRGLRDGIATLVWLYVLLKLFVFDIDVYLINQFVPTFSWLVTYKFVLFLVVFAALWLSLGHSAFFGFLAYVALFPGVLIFWKFPKLLLKRWPLFLLFAPLLYSAAKRARSTFTLYTLAIVAALIIAVHGNKLLTIGAMLSLGIFLLVHLYRSFRKAHSATAFQELNKLVREVREYIEKGRLEGPLPEAQPSSPSSKPIGTDAYLTQLYTLHAVADYVALRANVLLRRRVFDLYLIASWIYTVFVTSIVYALEYWALHRMDGASFQSGHDLGFWDLLGFSFGMLTTATVANIEPVSRAATLLSYAEVLCAVLVGVILVFSILTAARETFREDAEEFIAEVRKAAGAVERRLQEAYQLTLAQLETLVVKKNALLVTWLRRLRNLPELNGPS